MTILPIFYGIAAGLCLYASLYHLLVGLRQRPLNRTHLAFSLMTLLVTGIIVADGAYRLATTLEGIALALQIGITLTAFVLIAFIWFVAEYTGLRPRLFLWIMSLLFLLVGILNFILPAGVLYEEYTGFRVETMPWGESFVVIEGMPNDLQILNISLFLLVYGFCFIAIARQYRRGETRRALFLLLGISPIIFGTIFDFLLDFGVVTNFIGLYPISFVGLVLIMSLIMSDEVVRASVLQQEVAENERRMRSLLENVELVVIGLDAEGRVNYTNPFFTKITGFNPEEVLGKDFSQEFIPARLKMEVQAAFSDILAADTNRYYQNPILTKNGNERIISWANVRLRDKDERVIGTLSIGNDITDRMQTEAELKQYRAQLEELVEARTGELSRAVTELHTLNRVAQTVVAFMDLQTTLQRVCEAVAPLFEAVTVIVNVVDFDRDETNLLVGFYNNGEDRHVPGIGEFLPFDTTHIIQQVLQTSEPFTVTGLQSRAEAAPLILVDRNIDALLMVPLRSRGDPIGILGIMRDETGTEFDEEDVLLAETIAGYVASAVENAQLTQQLADSAVVEERNRIARELHDSVTQNLYTVATISDAIPDLWESHPEETHKALENLRRLSRGALAEMRILLLELRPASLLEKTLGQLLQQLGESVEGRSRIQVTTSIVGDQIFPDDVQVALYRIAQEALNNVIKHSEATRAIIGLYHEQDQLTLSVRDNGRGIDPNMTVGGGFGMENMKERARQIDAKLTITSQLETDTEVSVVWRKDSEENNE